MQTIRERRLAKGWSQFTLALKVGVHPQAVYLWEHGKRLPQVRPMRRLGVVFGLCSDDILLEPRVGPTRAPANGMPDGVPLVGDDEVETPGPRTHHVAATGNPARKEL